MRVICDCLVLQPLEALWTGFHGPHTVVESGWYWSSSGYGCWLVHDALPAQQDPQLLPAISWGEGISGRGRCKYTGLVERVEGDGMRLSPVLQFMCLIQLYITFQRSRN